MISLASTALLLASAGQLALSQFVAPPKNFTNKTGYANVPVRYKSVPAGICEQDPDVKSYSGYADVAPGQHIFWWFFESRNVDPTEAPLTIWINGGPGSSSMIGLFQELGPCRINENGKAVNNPYSWSNVSNMIFIDQPTQVGLSYSTPVPGYEDPQGFLVQLPNNTCPEYASDDWACGTYSYWNESLTANNTPAVAPNMWKTLQGFMGAFPEYARNEINFATESYGGHYAPLVSEYFVEQNALNVSGAHNINLQHVLIGNGWYDPLVQYQAYYNFTVFPGNTYNYPHLNQSVKDQWYNNLYGTGNCYDQTVDCNTHGLNEICHQADNYCLYEVENLYDIYLDRDEYDMRYLNTNPFPQSYYIDYLNLPRIQAAIGAYTNYSEGATAVQNAFDTTGDDDREIGTTAAIRSLLAANISVTMYFGDADYNCNWLGGQVVATNVNATGYAAAGFTNISTSDSVVHGQVRQAGKFSFVRIYESGHLVPFFQPLVSLELVDRTINGFDVATGKTTVTPQYATKGAPATTFREGNHTVQFKVTPEGSVYNTTTNLPMPPPDNGTGGKRLSKRKAYSLKEARRIQLETRRAKIGKREARMGVWKTLEEEGSSY